MASRRKAQSNGEAVQETRDTGDSQHERMRQHRKTLKSEVERDQRHRDRVRWGVAAIVLLVAAIGLYSYLTWYQEELPSQQTRGRSSEKGSGDSKMRVTKPVDRKREDGGKEKELGSKSGTTGKTGKTKTSKQSAGTSKGAKVSSNKERSSSKGSKPSDTKEGTTKKSKAKVPKTKASNKPPKATKNEGKKDYSKREGNSLREELNLNEIRVLRRPVGPADPDKPYVIEVLMGDNLLTEGRWSVALEKFNEILKMFPQSPRAFYGKGVALEHLALEKKSNKLMDTAIDFYSKAGLESFLAPDDVKVAALLRLAEVAQNRGKLPITLKALEKIQAIGRKNEVYAHPSYANRLGVAYLTANQPKKAVSLFEEVVADHPDNAFAKAHIGFLLFTEKEYEKALPMLLEGIRKDGAIRTNAKFYLYAGECLTRLDRTEESYVLYGEAVSLGLLPSLWQRSVYNEPSLRAQPWWSRTESGYDEAVGELERGLDAIREEALSLLNEEKATFPGDSNNLILFSKGKKNAENCRRAPKTCSLIDAFPEASSCKRGTVKMTALPRGTHIRPHTAPSNTKLEILLGVVGEEGTRVRVAEETRTVGSGDVVILDDSFETELWQQGSEVVILLSVDVWHPDLPESERRKLAPI